MTISYRDAVVADAPVLAELFASCFTDTFGHLYDPSDLKLFLDACSVDAWTAELSDPGYSARIAEQGDVAIGYAKLGPPKLPFEPRGQAAELRQLYVRKPWHGVGVARELTDWVLATARAGGADDLYLSVFIDNHRARRFYEKLGFVEEGTYAFMVGNHADEDIVMRLNL